MISSCKPSDRRASPKVGKGGLCDTDCQFFFEKDKDDTVNFNATCGKDSKEILYCDGYVAHCKENK